MTNLSRIPKFDVHTLVTGPFHGVGVVDNNTGSVLKGEHEVCIVRVRRAGQMERVGFDENDLRRVSFWRFLFHRNPDGSYQIGNNPLWLFILLCIGCTYGLLVALRGEYQWDGWVGRILLIGLVPAWIWFTGRQYIGKSR